MRSNRMNTLNLIEVKQAFMQSGMVDWHLSPDTMHRDASTPTVHSIRASNQDEHDSEHEQHHDTVLAPSRTELKPPPLYAVVLLNDDYTPMDFVIEILQQYFALNLDQATEVMLTVHYEGKGIANVYARDIAETKANQVNNYARSQGHPLLCMIEPKA